MRKHHARLATVLALCLVALSACTSCTSSRARLDFPLVFKTEEVLQVEVLQGQAQWAEQVSARVQGAVWKFNSDGTFTYSPANSRTDLYPMTGSYRISGNTLSFSASRTSQRGYSGSASAQIEGSIDLRSASPVLEMKTVSSSGMSAVVANTPYASATSSAYRIRATLAYD